MRGFVKPMACKTPPLSNASAASLTPWFPACPSTPPQPPPRYIRGAFRSTAFWPRPDVQSDAQGNSFRLPQLEAVPLRVHGPTKPAVVVVFYTPLHPPPLHPDLHENCFTI